MVVKAIAAGIGAAATVFGTVKTIQNQKKMVKEQQKANKFERQKQEIVTARQRLQAIREGRTALANSRQAAENQGVALSSSALGGQGSIVSQTNANLSFLDQYGFLSDQAGKALERAMGYQGNAQMWSSIADLGSTIFSQAGGIGAFGGGGGGGGGAARVGPAPPSPSMVIPQGDFWGSFSTTPFGANRQ